MTDSDKAFVEKMHNDIMLHVKLRYTTMAAKIGLFSLLIGIGFTGQFFRSTDSSNAEIPLGFLIGLPFLALMWDVLFLEQNFAVVRLRAFIKENGNIFGSETEWEQFVEDSAKHKLDCSQINSWINKICCYLGKILDCIIRRFAFHAWFTTFIIAILCYLILPLYYFGGNLFCIGGNLICFGDILICFGDNLGCHQSYWIFLLLFVVFLLLLFLVYVWDAYRCKKVRSYAKP